MKFNLREVRLKLTSHQSDSSFLDFQIYGLYLDSGIVVWSSHVFVLFNIQNKTQSSSTTRLVRVLVGYFSTEGVAHANTSEDSLEVRRQIAFLSFPMTTVKI